MAIRIDGNNDLINAADGSLTVEGISVNVVGVSTASGGYKVGSAYTVFPNGNVATAGVVTATSGNFTGGSATITGATAILHLVDENDNPNYRVENNNGTFRIYDATSDASRLNIDSSGNISVGTAATIAANGNITAGIVTASSAILRGDANLGYEALKLLNTQHDTNNEGAAQLKFGITNSLGERNARIEAKEVGGNANDIALDFYTNSTSGGDSESFRMRINYNGNVGLGTTVPSKLLHLNSANPVIRLSDTDTDGPLNVDIDGASGDLILDVPSVHRDVIIKSVGQTNEIARFTGDGLVGIGSDAPTHNLDIFSSSNAYIKILRAGYNPFYVGNAAGEGVLEATGDIFVKSGGSERFRIESDGHVGIASDVPTVALDVIGDVHLGSKKFIFDESQAHFGIFDSSTDTSPNNEIQIITAQPQIRLEENSSGGSKRLDLFVTSSGQPTIAANQSSQSIAFQTTNSERFRITNDGVTFNGDTAAANALSDYEEGTYTAHFNVEGQGNMTMSGRVGLYCKVGQVVTVMGGGTVASISGQGSGNAIQFTNLPFPVHTTSSGVGHPFPVLMKNMDSTGLGNMTGNQPYSFIGRLFTDSDAGRIEAIRADGAQDAVNASLSLAANTEMHYMFTYLTDA